MTAATDCHITERKSDSTWQRALAQAIRDPQELLASLNLTDRDVPELAPEASDQFSLKVPRSFLARMEAGNPNDPLLRQVLPDRAELTETPGFVSDAVGDAQAHVAPGLLQKYHGRVLMMATSTCAVHCRYCFRREYPYTEEPNRDSDWQPAFDYISGNNSVSEVILSGGDPLLLSDLRLQTLIDKIDLIPHIERIRIHTRLPVVVPSRVTKQLLDTLNRMRTQPVVVVHTNHAKEVVSDCKESLQRIVGRGIPVLNQAVLLKSINDTVADLENLCRSLINIGVIPYYLHQLDRVTGTAHFEVTRKQARQLLADLRTRLPGYAVPRLVQEVTGAPSKTPLDTLQDSHSEQVFI